MYQIYVIIVIMISHDYLHYFTIPKTLSKIKYLNIHNLGDNLVSWLTITFECNKSMFQK